ncbi:MAG: sigma-70 family RNA polymerase sigma factor [Chloroflexi bacterium]|nr:sigma-70 family RNA polymerase sigma factor [Chloroflexota bacterium]
MEASFKERAVDLAYREHAPEVYRVAFGVLRDREEAMDATHDAFARAWERWDQYDSQRSLLAWLHGIVVHVALDQLRRRRVRHQAIPVLGRATVDDPGGRRGADPASDFARRDVVDDALATLEPRTRAALVLRHYYGYDYAQIGAFLGIGGGTVGSMLSRAHAQLRRRLGPADAPRQAPPAVTSEIRLDRVLPHRADPDREPPEVLP